MERTTVQDVGSGSQSPSQPQEGALKRVVLVANETVAAPGVRDRIRELVGREKAEVFVVAPALTKTRFQQVTGEVDEAIEEARRRLETSVRALREAGISASGDVGESDPNLALEDALRRFPADEVVISTHPPGRSRWLEQDVVDKARAESGRPVTHVIVDMEKGGAEVTEVKRSPARAADADRAGATTYDLPRMPSRDYISIVVGIVGTIVLWILAAVCLGDVSEEGMSAGCAIRIGLAAAAFFVAVFHIAALLFFGSVRYRGRWSSFAADTMLFGIPPAIVIAAIVG
jgi:hypothetical protein